MSIAKKLATVPFAHLLGIRAESETEETEEERQEREEKEAKRAEWAKKAETDDDRKQREEETDEEYVSRMEEMDDEEARRAENDGIDDDDDEGDGDEKEKAARRAERARCARIVAHGISNGCVTQAAVFAFDTNLPVSAAVAAMKAAKFDGKGSLSGRMGTTSIPKVGADVSRTRPEGGAAAQADAIINAAKKARGE